MLGIYENVSEIAAKKKIPLYKLEKEAGLAAGAITKWKNTNPRIDTLISVANVLGVSVNRLTKERT